MALPTGFPPASFRLEGGCLMCSATTAFEIGQRGRIGLPNSCKVFPQTRRSLRERQSTCGHPVPSRALSRLSYAPKTWRTRRELHPQPSRRQRDALLIELRVRNGGKRWERSSSSLPILFSDT